jgi:predicted ATPase
MPCEYITPVSHRTSRRLATAFDQVLKKRQKAELLSLLQLFSPDVADVEYLSPEGRTAVIHLYHQGIGHIPLAIEGDGMRRTLAFATAATLASGGILLVDEIETALHPEALAGVYRFLIRACRLADVQLFATTHSLEAVDAILAACDNSLDSLAAYRLPAKSSGDVIKRFGGETVHHLRHENAMDLR